MLAKIYLNSLIVHLLKKGINEKLQPTSMRIINLIVVELIARSNSFSRTQNLVGFLPFGNVINALVDATIKNSVLEDFNLKMLASKLDVEERSISRAINELTQKKIIKREKVSTDKRMVLYSLVIPNDLKNEPIITSSMNKKEFIKDLALDLKSKGEKMIAPDLCDELNKKGYTTDSGNSFDRQGRGIYKLLSGTYKTLKDQGKNDEAEAVAEAFTKPDGNYAFN